MQDLGFSSVEIHGVPITSFLQPVQFTLNSSSPCQNIDFFHQSHIFSIFHKIVESPLSPIIPSLIQTLNNIGPSDDPCGTPLTSSCQLGLHAADHHALCLTVQPIFQPPYYLLIYPTYQQFAYLEVSRPC